MPASTKTTLSTQLSVRLSKAERRKLEQLAQQAGRSPSNYVRWWLSKGGEVREAA